MASRLHRQLQRLTAHLVVALVALVVIGGATRVMQAGLACPDWPLCYGSFLPGRQMNLQVFLEWFHRLDAFVVGMGVLVLATTAVVKRQQLPQWLPWLSWACLVLVAFQGALGALTVTLLLPAGIVTAHLATALLLVILISVCHQLLGAGASSLATEPLGGSLGAPGLPATRVVPGPGARPLPTAPRWWPWLAGLATLLVAAQSLLGGLMATQWAASLCLSAGNSCAWLGAHRLAATPAALGVLLLAVITGVVPGWCRQQRPLTTTAALLVISQIGLGVASLRLQLSVPGVTIAHQLVAALLLAILAALTCRGWLASGPQPISAPAPAPRAVLSPSPAEVVHG
ncbi:MAG: COX15/CtaA family protein [Synechococcales cyanobacterium SupBloom_Metag_052]|nr:COX15/CtaA family protein [Synechococcales cyanobacterium SupBloom_Metag_052]